MKRKLLLSLGFALSVFFSVTAQESNPVVEAMIKEANNNSQLESLGHELMDGIGPRLVGTPQMKNAHDWAVAKYSNWI